MTDHDRHDLELRDVREGRLVVSYVSIYRDASSTVIRDVSTRLPFECVTVFDGGTVEVDDLSAEERAWIRAEAEPNDVDFEGVAV